MKPSSRPYIPRDQRGQVNNGDILPRIIDEVPTVITRPARPRKSRDFTRVSASSVVVGTPVPPTVSETTTFPVVNEALPVVDGSPLPMVTGTLSPVVIGTSSSLDTETPLVVVESSLLDTETPPPVVTATSPVIVETTSVSVITEAPTSAPVLVSAPVPVLTSVATETPETPIPVPVPAPVPAPVASLSLIEERQRKKYLRFLRMKRDEFLEFYEKLNDQRDEVRKQVELINEIYNVIDNFNQDVMNNADLEFLDRKVRSCQWNLEQEFYSLEERFQDFSMRLDQAIQNAQTDREKRRLKGDSIHFLIMSRHLIDGYIKLFDQTIAGF